MGDFGLNYKLNQFELVYFGLNWLKPVSIGSKLSEWLKNGWEPVRTSFDRWWIMG